MDQWTFEQLQWRQTQTNSQSSDFSSELGQSCRTELQSCLPRECAWRKGSNIHGRQKAYAHCVLNCQNRGWTFIMPHSMRNVHRHSTWKESFSNTPVFTRSTKISLKISSERDMVKLWKWQGLVSASPRGMVEVCLHWPHDSIRLRFPCQRFGCKTILDAYTMCCTLNFLYHCTVHVNNFHQSIQSRSDNFKVPFYWDSAFRSYTPSATYDFLFVELYIPFTHSRQCTRV